MKKSVKVFFVALVLGISCLFTVLGAACGSSDAPYEVGTDTTTYEVDGHSEYAYTYSAYVKIVAGEDVLYNGEVTLTSDNMWASEFTYAAIVEKGISQEGVLMGFVTTIGEYTSGDGHYWVWSLNGKSAGWAANSEHIHEGDYILWSFDSFDY